jgi:hypothetical protein
MPVEEDEERPIEAPIKIAMSVCLPSVQAYEKTRETHYGPA